MKTSRAVSIARLTVISMAFGLGACTSMQSNAPPVTVVANSPNVVSYWNDIANKTVLATSNINTTPEEQRATFFFDVASVHVAIYDAVVAIEGRYKPFAAKPKGSGAGASVDAAVSAAAYGVLKALFPNRGAQYQAAFEQRVAALPDGQAKTLGLALGTEVAAEVVRLRANDGRMVALLPYVSGTAAGQFRAANPNPVFRHFPAIKPFALNRSDQFRPAPPPATGSAAYADAVKETQALGAEVSTARTAEQTQAARFHTEPPPTSITRNLGRFASSTANVGDAARLMATIYVSYVDAIAACFDAKYHYAAWRPFSAINVNDPAWKPSMPTPNHPEYPAAHSCTSGSVGEALKSYYGTPNVTFTWDSTVTNTTRSYNGIDAFNAEAGRARIFGGMHFTHSTVAGEALGKQVAQWVAARHFVRQD